MSPGCLGAFHFLLIPSFSSSLSLTIFHDNAISNLFLILFWMQSAPWLPLVLRNDLGFFVCWVLFLFSLHLILARNMYPSFFMQFPTQAKPWICFLLEEKPASSLWFTSWTCVLWCLLILETLSLRALLGLPSWKSHRVTGKRQPPGAHPERLTQNL